MGERPPGRVGNPPSIEPSLLVWWTAWQDLSTERKGGVIPFLAMLEYSKHTKLDLDLMKRILWGLEEVYVKHQKAKSNG